ncbi:hypothetical protein RO3G_04801 [Rhizopus delemar RA 99-880]|uniref:Uncharacterized protein n=1 Tax=Rhizopus delemar (strain RA 99-880 / ATCC MYA-4621 / FGSC 9543 / NRRL 43880) TaxID=246409 RepID=I1BV66_RHIO9|nr:hypothetical protein RO3G_04801 [Rhizopus delemar RA 99-880]|eukprot:EIE80096.1 hypothetical protein RO3G_04801 [Rhizopus delemar RA 99-880]
MISSINQSPAKNVEKDSADEVAKSLDRMDLETLESRASNSSIHPSKLMLRWMKLLTLRYLVLMMLD